jgi:segregation and condensation protein A
MSNELFNDATIQSLAGALKVPKPRVKKTVKAEAQIDGAGAGGVGGTGDGVKKGRKSSLLSSKTRNTGSLKVESFEPPLYADDYAPATRAEILAQMPEELKADLLATVEGAALADVPSEIVAGSFAPTAEPDSGIEILVKMAEKGEIDPKNVDIIDVCDKFLKAIAASPKESLRLSGKVIFHAAVLLRMKAEALLSLANSSLNPIVDDFLDFDDEGGPILYDSNKQEVGRQLTFKDLEGAIVRRSQRKKQPLRERKVTLEQLIAALREAEKVEKTRQQKKPKATIDLSDHHEVNAYDDILDLAHDEDIQESIELIEQWIVQNMLSGQNIEVFDLVMKLSVKQDWVEVFLAALFLSNAGKIDLMQETFYGPLFLTLAISPPSTDSSTTTES